MKTPQDGISAAIGGIAIHDDNGASLECDAAATVEAGGAIVESGVRLSAVRDDGQAADCVAVDYEVLLDPDEADALARELAVAAVTVRERLTPGAVLEDS